MRFIAWQPYELRSLSISSADIHVVGLARGLAGYVVPSRLYGDARGRPAGDRRRRGRERDRAARRARSAAASSCRRATRSRSPRAIRAAHDGEFDLAEMGRRARAFAESEADRSIAIGRYRAVLAELSRRRDRPRGRLLGVARRARLDARRATRSRLRWLARVAAPAASAGGRPRRRDGDRRRVQRGGRDRAAAREPARARLPGRPARDRRHLRRLRRPHGRARRGGRRPRAAGAADRCPRGGKVAAQDRAVRETDGEIVAFSDANATWAPDALAQARPLVRRPGRRVRLRPAGADRRGRLEPRGRLLALRDVAARAGVGARLGHGRQRLDLRGAALGLRRGRSALRPRPLAAVRDGAARPAGGLRPRGDRASRSRRPRSRPSTGARCACSSTAG